LANFEILGSDDVERERRHITSLTDNLPEALITQNILGVLVSSYVMAHSGVLGGALVLAGWFFIIRWLKVSMVKSWFNEPYRNPS
jgi:hypothetical protein